MSKLTYATADSVLVETTCVQNKMAFDDESLLGAAEKLERWYNGEIEFRDVKNRSFGSPASLITKPYRRRWII